MPNERTIVALLWFCRIFVGLLFIISGLIKVNDIVGFAYKLEEYFHVFENDFGLPSKPFTMIAVPLSGVISAFEVVLGVFLLVGFAPVFTTYTLLAMIVFFTFLTGYSAVFNKVTDCGCFGDALKLTPWQSFTKDIVLLILIGYLFAYRRFIQPMFPMTALRAVVIASTLLISGLTFYTWYFLPIIDFRPACVGCNLRKNTTPPNDTTAAKLDNYFPFSDKCQADEFKGLTLLVFMRDMGKVSSARFKALNDLHKELNGSGIKMMAATASASDAIESLKKEHNIPYCIHQQDETLIKTVIRSNPGLLLLKEGVVVGQWPNTALPNRADLEAKLSQ
jgi:uncharacterized membrane protein YphA (DoxX/SURF4 family)